MHAHGCDHGHRAGWSRTFSGRFRDGGGRDGFAWGGSGDAWAWDRNVPRRRDGGRPRGRMFAAGELRLVLLKLIANEARHGYELIKAIKALTGGRYAPSPGVVYPTLSLLLDEGAVEEVGDQAPRKAFAATAAGRAELARRQDEAEALLARLKEHGEDGRGRHAPPIARAIGNLLAALRDRTAAGELDRETVHQIADILDDAARKVERL